MLILTELSLNKAFMKNGCFIRECVYFVKS